MFSEFAAAPSKFNIGDTIAIPNTPKSGVVVRIFFNQWSNQYVYVTRCPLYPVTVMWAEPAVVASQSISAVMDSDMVIVLTDAGEMHTGVVVGAVSDKHLAVRFGDETHAVHMTRIQRVVPVSSDGRAAFAA